MVCPFDVVAQFRERGRRPVLIGIAARGFDGLPQTGQDLLRIELPIPTSLLDGRSASAAVIDVQSLKHPGRTGMLCNPLANLRVYV